MYKGKRRPKCNVYKGEGETKVKCVPGIVREMYSFNFSRLDFGFATAMKVGYTTTNCGTYEYAAPELCDKAVSAYDGKKTDVWSL